MTLKADEPAVPCARRDARAIVFFAAVAIGLVAADLFVKSVSFARVAGVPVVLRSADGGRVAIPPHAPRRVVPGVLALHLTVNEGAVFGLGRGGRWLFIVFSVAASAAIVVAFGRSGAGATVLHLALAAVLAGALGNLYDRLRFGVVRDMLHLLPGVHLPFGLRWPGGDREVYPWIFNVADVCLVVGLITLVILMHRHDRRAAKAVHSPLVRLRREHRSP